MIWYSQLNIVGFFVVFVHNITKGWLVVLGLELHVCVNCGGDTSLEKVVMGEGRLVCGWCVCVYYW